MHARQQHTGPRFEKVPIRINFAGISTKSFISISQSIVSSIEKEALDPNQYILFFE